MSEPAAHATISIHATHEFVAGTAGFPVADPERGIE